MISSLWGFDDDDTERYCEAVTSEDWETLDSLLKKNRRFIAKSRKRFHDLAEQLLTPTEVPTLPCSAEDAKPSSG